MAGSPMWLLGAGTLSAAAELARSMRARALGLLGRDGLDGALVIPARSVHTVGMRFPIDVAFLSKELEVLDTIHMVPWRVAVPRLRSRMVLEAEAGAFERWHLNPGDHLELRGGE